MKMRRRVLIISTMFPPRIGSGVRRVLGFFKYLPDFGWEPHVLTAVPSAYYMSTSPDDVPERFGAGRIVRTPFFDIRLLGKKLLLMATGRRVPATPAEAVRARAAGGRSRELLWSLANTFVFVPDPEIGWYWSGVRAGISIMQKAGIDAIVSSAPPFTAHLIALRLKRETGRPWVADFRDPWSQRAYGDVAWFHSLRRPIDRFLERRVMGAADAIATVSAPIADAFGELRVKGMERNVRVITNGYDPDEYTGVTHRAPAEFTVTYTGSFYGRARSPEPFMAALAELLEKGALRRDKVRVRIIETFPQQTAILAARYKVSDVFTVRAGLSHAESVQEQVNASVLLLIVRNDSGGIGAYTGKLFEYLAARRPILALAPENGVAAELIREAKAGVVVNPRDRREIKRAILGYYSQHERNGCVAYQGREDVIRRYERPILAGQLAGVLDSLVTGCPRAKGCAVIGD